MAYPLIAPPHDLPLEPLAGWNARTLVDYERHPAYAELVRQAGPGDRLRALRRLLPSFFSIKIKRLIRYEMIPLHVRSGPTLGLLATALRHLFTPARPHALDTQAPGLTPLDLAFRRQGVMALAMPSADFAQVEALSRANFEWLEQRRAATAGGERDFEASRSYARRDQASALFTEIERVFRESGVLATASAYLGREARLVDVNPQINDPSDDFWRRIFPDLPDMPRPFGAYFHRDASGGDIKAIIYMSDVGAEQGPFGYVVGSHRMPLDRGDDHVSEANDSNGMAGTGPANRRDFAALPPSLRHKGAFGNDLIDETPVAQAIRHSLWTITAPKGSIVMFDTKGVHRGSMVTQGERRVITCVVG